MKVNLVCPRFCWHSDDLLALQRYRYFDYVLIYDTPPFISRQSFSVISNILWFVSFEYFQRLWRLLCFIPWTIIVSIRLRSNNYPIHCHGLFAFLVVRLACIPSARIVFTPQGSDVLVRSFKNKFVREFLRINLLSVGAITADSLQLLDRCGELAPGRASNHYLIQNGIDFSILDSTRLDVLKYDICWPRGLSNVYQFDHFLSVLTSISQLTDKPISVCIIGAYGNSRLISRLFELPNVHLNLQTRLPPSLFYNELASSKVVVSIPSSDSSPRTVYESVYLMRPLFLTELPFLRMMDNFNKSTYPVCFCSGDAYQDALQLLAMIRSYTSYLPMAQSYVHSTPFFDTLHYEHIANQFYQVYHNID